MGSFFSWCYTSQIRNLEISALMACQAYDGVNVMSGIKNGLQINVK